MVVQRIFKYPINFSFGVINKLGILRNHMKYCGLQKIASVKNFSLTSASLIEVTFIKQSGERIKVKAQVGDSLQNVVAFNNIDLGGFGACGGSLTCSTCHVIFKKEDFDRLPKPTVEELDMLDLVQDLKDTSRLGCQVVLNEQLNGLEVNVPAVIRDARTI